MNKYELIFEAVQEALDNNKITLEEAEALNDYAFDKYIMEDGHSKKLKARHNAQKRNIEKRFYDNMNFKYDHTDKEGNKHGTVQRGDGRETPLIIHKKNLEDGPHARRYDAIHMSRQDVRQKGSDLVGSHEYSHTRDYDKATNLKANEMMNDDAKRYIKLQKILDSDVSNKKKEKAIKKYNKESIKKYGSEKYDNKFYKKAVQDEGWGDMAKDVKKHFKINNKHDKEPQEMHADHYAMTTTKGENNTNRDRKNLNELSRRMTQSSTDRQINKYETLKKEMMDNRKNPDTPKHKKVMDSMRDRIKLSKEKIYMDDWKAAMKNGKKHIQKTNETRKNVNDYILKKKQEEKNKEE